VHSKFAVVDARLCVVGSSNLDPFALNVLEEGSLVVEDAALTEELGRAFLEDLTYSARCGGRCDGIPRSPGCAAPPGGCCGTSSEGRLSGSHFGGTVLPTSYPGCSLGGLTQEYPPGGPRSRSDT
jgi:hypothetical protein